MIRLMVIFGRVIMFSKLEYSLYLIKLD